MLLAELKGHVVRAALNDEDYLTSEVFGHLRYLPPNVFWDRFLGFATTLLIDGEEWSFGRLLRDSGIEIREYSHLRIHFWPSHKTFGHPDMAMCFTGEQPPLTILMEVKLDSPKSGCGANDQLSRYLNIASDLGNLTPSVSQGGASFVIYLTPRDSTSEVEESLRVCGDSTTNRKRLLRLQWQDMIRAIDLKGSEADSIASNILSDVQRFLKRRGLDYFNGVTEIDGMADLLPSDGCFYGASKA